MIYDKIPNLKRYPLIRNDMIEFISQVTKETPAGRYELKDGAFALVQNYTSKVPEECCFEAHRTYIDLQCVLNGQEIIDYAPLDGGMEAKTPYDNAKDIAFYYDATFITRLRMTSGSFAVFYPDEAHKPCQTFAAPVEVIKVVIKIPSLF